MSRPTRLVAAALVVCAAAACVTLTPEQEKSAAEVRALAGEAFRIYKVPSIPIVIGAHVKGTGGTYEGGMFTVGSGMLASTTRDVVVAHELAHYILGHDGKRLNVTTIDRRAIYEQWELDANAKGVEILSRAKPMPEELALSLFYQHGIGAHRVGGIPFGHKPPCEELADLLARFPRQRAWTATLECAKTAPSRRATILAQPPSREGSRSERVVWSYFVNRGPASGARIDKPEDFPRRVTEYDRSQNVVILFVMLEASTRPTTVTVKWSDERSVQRKVTERTLEPTTGGTFSWHTQVVPMWEMRPYPGRWTARVGVDDRAVGEYSFRLLD